MRKLLINLLITLKNVQYVHYVYLVFFCPVCTVEKLYNIYLLYNINKTVHGCTTGTRVWVDSSSRVRIPPSPPKYAVCEQSQAALFYAHVNQIVNQFLYVLFATIWTLWTHRHYLWNQMLPLKCSAVPFSRL